MIEIDETTTVEFEPTRLNEHELQLLAAIGELEDAGDGEHLDVIRLDLKHIVRVLTLYDSIATFRYDWRWKYRDNGSGLPRDE